MIESGFTDDNQTAFPCDRDNQTWGLTKREYFAVMALQGMLANAEFASIETKDLVPEAIIASKLLIDELNKTTNNND